jgi:hypothetical protein
VDKSPSGRANGQGGVRVYGTQLSVFIAVDHEHEVDWLPYLAVLHSTQHLASTILIRSFNYAHIIANFISSVLSAILLHSHCDVSAIASDGSSMQTEPCLVLPSPESRPLHPDWNPAPAKAFARIQTAQSKAWRRKSLLHQRNAIWKAKKLHK